MSIKCDSDDAAFARPEACGIEAQYGLTKREEFAKAAMQGFCANPTMSDITEADIAALSVRQADALIAELNK